MQTIKDQIISLTIQNPNDKVEINDVTIDQNFDRVIGIQATNSTGDLQQPPTLASHFEEFTVNGKEVYPKGYELKMISAGLFCPISGRFDNSVDLPNVKGTNVDIVYQDVQQGANPTYYPYTLNIYLRLKKD